MVSMKSAMERLAASPSLKRGHPEAATGVDFLSRIINNILPDKGSTG